MERKIGEKFTVDGKTYIVEKGEHHCDGCAFHLKRCTANSDIVSKCISARMIDHTAVIFKEVNINKSIKMKPFNLEEAKAGKPVCTRRGIPARIICYDYTRTDYPIIALVGKTLEVIHVFTVDGRYLKDSETIDDLMMVTEKKQGWINVYKSTAHENGAETSGCVYETEEIAKQYGKDDDYYIGTFPFEWEE